MPLPYRSSFTRTILGRLLITGLIAVSVFGLLVREGVVAVPNTLNPVAPLNVKEAPGWLTGYKLGRLERDAVECRTVLGGSPITSSPVPDQVTGEGCGFSNAVDVERSSVRFNSRFPATCPLAVGWAMFELHVLQPAAQQHLGREVVSAHHFGTYSCRNLYHREDGRRSEHATANAIDIADFFFADGTQVSVQSDWNGPAPKAAFLRAIRDGACRFFDVVLSPDYNEAHRDHLHFDMGEQSACR
jgi:hypothetical protein